MTATDVPEPGGWHKVALDHLAAAEHAMAQLTAPDPRGGMTSMAVVSSMYLASIRRLVEYDWRHWWRTRVTNHQAAA